MTSGGDYTEGRIGLAVSRQEGLVLLDVKTSDCDRMEAEARARQYAPQRDVYISAVEGIGGIPVATFAFQFPKAGQIAESITELMRADAKARFVTACDQIAAGASTLTSHPGECIYVGPRSAGWFEAV